MSLQRGRMVNGQSLGEACFSGSWGTGAVPEGAGCFALRLALGMDMTYSFPLSKKQL